MDFDKNFVDALIYMIHVVTNYFPELFNNQSYDP